MAGGGKHDAHDDHSANGGGGHGGDDHGDHGGGGHCPPPWILTFADMATLLMAFFVIMLMTAKTDQPKFNAFAAVMRQTFGSQEPLGKVNGGPSVINMMPTPENGSDASKDTDESSPAGPGDGADAATERRNREAQALGQMIQDAVAKGEVTVQDSVGNDVVVKVPGGDGGAEAFAAALEATIKEQLLGQSEEQVASEQSGLEAASGSAGETAQQAQTANGQSEAGSLAATDGQYAGQETGQDTGQESGQIEAAPTTMAENPPSGPEAAEAQRRASVRAELAQIETEMLLSDAISAGEVQVELNGTAMVITLGSGGAFASGSADMTEEARAILAKLEQVSNKASRIVVTGHTDNVPVSGGAFDDNWDLAAARANSVVRVIEESGKLPNTELLAVSRGDSEPVADNATPEGREKNRRIEIKIEYDQPSQP